jgi:hypothetical protein
MGLRYIQASKVRHRLCPICEAPVRLLELSCDPTRVDYYHCDQCRIVWAHEKDNPDAPPEPVTIRPPKAPS